MRFMDKNLAESYLAEPRSLLSKQRGLSNAARVHTAESNSSAFMISSVQFGNGHHIANLAIFVGLGTKKWLAIRHGNWLFRSCFKAGESSKVCLGVDESTAFINQK